MRSFLAGKAISLGVLFELDGETVVPTAGTVSYTLRDNAGASISGLEDVDVTTTSDTTSIKVTIPDTANVKTLDFEIRTLEVSYEYENGEYTIQIPYRLVGFIPVTADAKSVRTLIGLADNELPDEDIDIYAAYLKLADDVGSSSAVTTALTSGSIRALAANEALVARAALDLLPSLQLRALQSEKSENASVTRLAKIDFKALGEQLTSIYSRARDSMTSSDTASGISIIATTSPTDAITG